jgi:hypothetical protein
MAERRMFAKTIIDSDAFIDMPVTARLLYYDLAMRADDDGFINSPKKIMRMIGASQDDLSILILRKFIIPFENGVVVIKHWRIHNYIRKDMYHETKYKEEKELLGLDENNAYTLSVTKYETDSLQGCNDVVSIPYTQVRLGKDRLGKDSIESKSKAFTPPSLDDVTSYCHERNNTVDPQRFIDFYESKGWMVGKNKMKDWKAAIRTWEQRDKESSPKKDDSLKRDYSDADYLAFERKKLGIT